MEDMLSKMRPSEIVSVITLVPEFISNSMSSHSTLSAYEIKILTQIKIMIQLQNLIVHSLLASRQIELHAEVSCHSVRHGSRK